MKVTTMMVESLARLVRPGGAWHADAFAQYASGHGMFFEDGKIEQTSSFGAGGIGVRALVEDHAVFSHAPGVSSRAAQQGLRDLEELLGLPFPSPGVFQDSLLVDPIELEASPSWDFAREVDQDLRRASSAVRQVSLSFRTSLSSVKIFRSDGKMAEERRPYTTFSLSVVVGKDATLQTGSETRALRVPSKLFLEGFDPRAMGHSALERALIMLDAPPCPAGPMPVILAGEAGGTMIHEACGHGLEADIVQKDFSVYRDALDSMVSTPCVTLVDDPTLPDLYGSYAVDDEGTASQRTILVDQGMLRRYLTDLQSARRGGLPLSGNGRRESYRHLPIPRMSNTHVMPGTTPLEDMLAQAERGLFVRRLGGGEVDPTSGDFVFAVTEGYLVEKGRVGSPVRGATLTGNGPEVLRRILAVGSSLHMDPGSCGKNGQGVPVTDGQPTLLLESLVVGGSDSSHA